MPPIRYPTPTTPNDFFGPSLAVLTDPAYGVKRPQSTGGSLTRGDKPAGGVCVAHRFYAATARRMRVGRGVAAGLVLQLSRPAQLGVPPRDATPPVARLR